jgi:hypothetical protein
MKVSQVPRAQLRGRPTPLRAGSRPPPALASKSKPKGCFYFQLSSKNTLGDNFAWLKSSKCVFNLIAIQAITLFANLKQEKKKNPKNPSSFTTQYVNCQIAKAVFYFLIMTMWDSGKFKRKISTLLSRFCSWLKGNDRSILLRIMAFMNGRKKNQFVGAEGCVCVCVCVHAFMSQLLV